MRLAVINAVLNPIIGAAMCKSYRNGYKFIFCRIFHFCGLCTSCNVNGKLFYLSEEKEPFCQVKLIEYTIIKLANSANSWIIPYKNKVLFTVNLKNMNEWGITIKCFHPLSFFLEASKTVNVILLVQ